MTEAIRIGLVEDDQVEAGNRDALDLLPDHALDQPDRRDLVRGHERVRIAGLGRAAGASDPVHVVLHLRGDIVVDHVRDAADVQPALRNVGRDQHADPALAEFGEGLVALGLALVGVERGGADAGVLEIPHHAIRPDLHSSEDQHGVHLGLLEELDQQGALPAPWHRIHGVADRRGRRRPSRHLDDVRPAQVLPRQHLHLGRHGGAEEQRLPVARHGADEAVDLRSEPHVEHAIRLVQHKDFEPFEGDVAAFEVIDQPPRRRDHHVDTVAQGALLRLHADPAVHRRHPEPSVPRVLPEAALHLLAELACWRQDEGAETPGAAEQTLGDREREGGGLAGARLRQPHHVTAGQNDRNRLALDRRGLAVPGVPNGAQHVGGEPEAFERGEGRPIGAGVRNDGGLLR